MGTRLTKSKIETLQDLKSLVTKATPAVLNAWAAEDKKKKKTGGVNAAFVTKLRVDLKSLDGVAAA